MRVTGKNNLGTILRIQRMSTEDGPGIRSTIFFKGCPLSCLWCHNPESISPKAQVHWTKIKCIGCLSCIEACEKKALAMAQSGLVIDRSKCDSCGACAEVCPSTAMDIYGEVYQLNDLVGEVLKDNVYFQKSGGGVTLSGGEPAMQAAFSRELLNALKVGGVHTALDTCGQCSWEILESLLPHTDLIMYDLKTIDSEKHKKYAGIPNDRILENLIRLGLYMKRRDTPRELWIRTPVIPGCTAAPENIKNIGIFINKHVGEIVSKWELCTFNNLCLHKYEGLGIDWNFRNAALLSSAEAERLAWAARNSGVNSGIVHLSGPMRMAEPNEAITDINIHASITTVPAN